MSRHADPTAETPALSVARLSRRRAHAFHLKPDAGAREALAGELGLLALRKADFRGNLEPTGREDWRLVAALGATIVQPCIVTHVPVTTRIDVAVERRFVADIASLSAPEGDSPDDDSLEPLGSVIDLADILREALSLALPDYPRAADAPSTIVAPPDSAAIPEPDPARRNPFAVLAEINNRPADKKS